MDFGGWSWTAYWVGVATALAPSVLAFFYFLWRAPVIDQEGRIVRDDEMGGPGGGEGAFTAGRRHTAPQATRTSSARNDAPPRR
jgi:hypothetical protein